MAEAALLNVEDCCNAWVTGGAGEAATAGAGDGAEAGAAAGAVAFVGAAFAVTFLA